MHDVTTTSLRTARSAAFIAALLLLGGCSTIEGLFDRGGADDRPQMVPLAERPVEEPQHPHRFALQWPEQGVVGEPQVVFAEDSDTLADLARTYGLGYDEIVAANPGVNPWLPGDGTPILLPTQYLLPDGFREGVVLNIATRRLFYFPQAGEGATDEVLTFPIGIGRVGWETPTGITSVIAKARDPVWYPPVSVRTEHAEMGDPLPAVVPPGPDNPLGHRVLKLDIPGYLIHGTNQPYGVGMRVSHGCVRLYPENIEELYELVGVGMSVAIVNEPYQLGLRNGELFFESHAPLEDDALSPDERLEGMLARAASAGLSLTDDDIGHLRAISSAPDGVPVRVAVRDSGEVLARARLVRNTVVEDPDAPTLEEVRQMIDEASVSDDATP